MLVLTRKVGQEIIVPGCGLVLTLLEVRGEQARVGITAPPDVHVYRREVWCRIQANSAADDDRSRPAEDSPGKEGTSPNDAEHPA